MRSIIRGLALAATAGAAVLGLSAVPASAAPAPAAHAAPAAVVPHAQAGATLVGASITFNTLNDDKDGDTLLDVEVLDPNGNLGALAQDFFGLFPDQSAKTIPLDVAGITAGQLNGGHLLIDITPNGNDTWIFGYRLKLSWSDGTSTLVARNNIVLTQSSRSTTAQLTTV